MKGADPQLVLAEQAFRAGNAVLAESLLRAVLKRQPGTSRAHELLGYLAGNRGDLDSAWHSLQQATALPDASAESFYYLASMLSARDQTPGAVDALRRALTIAGPFFEALHDLGVALTRCGQLSEALKVFHQALALRPDSAPALNNRGMVLLRLHRLDEAITDFEASLTRNRALANPWINLGDAQFRQEHHERALASYDQAIALDPGSGLAWSHRGACLHEMARHDEALASYDEALRRAPDDPEVHSQRGIYLGLLGRHSEALAAHDEALRRNPRLATAWTQRGAALRALRRLPEALESHNRALALEPEGPDHWLQCGVTLFEMRRFSDALHSNDEALKAAPGLVDAWIHRGNALVELRRLDEAAESYRRATALKRDAPQLLGSLLHARAQLCDWTDQAALTAEIGALLDAGTLASAPFPLLATATDNARLRRAAELFVADTPHRTALPAAPRALGARLRIGYFSSDFRDHPVGQLTAPLFEHHDRQRFEVFGFGLTPSDASEVGARVRQAFDRYTDLSAASDAQAAEQVHALQLDLAVDLNVHTAGHRRALFAARLAPVQLAWLGYAGTSGAPWIDYLLADRVVIPDDERPHYSESILRLPDTFFFSDDALARLDAAPPRSAAGLPAQGTVYCSFNNPYKISAEVFKRWMNILRTVPDSVLWLGGIHESARHRLQEAARSQGISTDRLVFAARTDSRREHLARLQLADLFLDTVHYNAHTTASDALWAGVPVLTCPDSRFAGRVAASLALAAGLDDCVVPDLETYESRACSLGQDPGGLAALRETLRHAKATRPAFDSRRMTRQIEAVWEAILARHHRGEAPSDQDF